MPYRVFLLFLLLGLQSAGLRGQVLEVGVGAGGAGYIGDLNQRIFKISGASAGTYIKANLDPYWAVGAHYNYGRIEADDLKSSSEYSRARGLNFYNNLHELSLQADFNFLEYFAGGGKKAFTPYVFTGLGLVFFNPKADYQHPGSSTKTNYRLRTYDTEGVNYRNSALSIPYGIGAKFRLKGNWGLYTQAGYRTAFTDYIDDVSGSYLDPSDPSGDPGDNVALRMMLSNPTGIGSPDTQRGDFRKSDSYMFVGIGISFTFASEKCYTF